jgi:glycosyltransferase involved in cell wall biosynthesis
VEPLDGPARRVCRIITRLNIGGPARQALLLTAALRPEHETTLLAGTPTADEGELGAPGVDVVRVPLVREIAPAVDARALVAVRGELARRRPHIVHTHMAKAGTVGRLASLTLRPRPRTVHTFHGHVLDGYFGQARQRAFVEAERLLARSTDVLIAISEEVRDELLELRIGRPEQYRLIRLGLDLSALRAGVDGRLRAALGLPATTPLIGTVGRLVPIKDHALLLEAMLDLPGVHLAVLGDGELRAELEARTIALGLADRVHFTGWWADVASAMVDLDVVVLSSRNEGTPVALIEAAAAGRASVATDVGGVRTVVRDGINGLVVPPAAPRPFADAVRALLADPERRAAMGEAGRAISREFEADRLVADIRALYAELGPR